MKKQDTLLKGFRNFELEKHSAKTVLGSGVTERVFCTQDVTGSDDFERVTEDTPCVQ